MPFLPTTKEENNNKPFDFIMITVDAYVDHPSFGHAIISRLIEKEGFSVGIIPQPTSKEEYQSLGKPNIAFLVSGGVVDSMVSKYTVAKNRRESDSYSEGGELGKVPDRAITVHTRELKKYFSDSFVIIGGIEASLRRFAHYDYWSDSVMPSVLATSGADLLIYGMGENPFWDILARLKQGKSMEQCLDVNGCGYMKRYEAFDQALLEQINQRKAVFLPSYANVVQNKKDYVKAFNMMEENSEYYNSCTLLQKTENSYVIMNRPSLPLNGKQMDTVYSYPYMRTYHPRYKKGVPAIEEVKFSLTSHRGCFGNCSYCALTIHQGRLISARSHESIIKEAKLLTTLPDFKGYINDVGGPSANFRIPQCDKALSKGSCRNRQCIGFERCPNLNADHSDYISLLRKLRELPKIKKVFIRSGIRFDYLLYDQNCMSVLKELVEHHISGQLKVAPEHCATAVLKQMNKPPFEVYQRFYKLYEQINSSQNKQQFLVPYLISSHPGCTLKNAVELACYLKSVNFMPLQVQDFYPTPSTRATTEFYTGLDVKTLQPIYVAKNSEDKKKQRALLQYRLPKNFGIIREALIATDNQSLIGKKKECLVPPEKPKPNNS